MDKSSILEPEYNQTKMGGENIVNNNGGVDGDEEDLKIAALKLAKKMLYQSRSNLEQMYKRSWDIFEQHAIFLVGFVGFSILIIYIVGQLVKGLVGLFSIKNIKDRRVTKSTNLKKLGNDFDVNDDEDDDDDIDDDYVITNRKNSAPYTTNHNQRQSTPPPPPPPPVVVVASPPTPRRHLHHKHHRQSSTLAYFEKKGSTIVRMT